MALAAAESLDNLNEIEELEMTEADEALLRNLLEESMNEESREDGATNAVQSMDVSDGSDAKIDKLQFHDLDWRDVMGMADPEALPLSPDEAMAWGIDNALVGMVDFTCHGDYYQVYSAVISDETTYCRLWEE